MATGQNEKRAKRSADFERGRRMRELLVVWVLLIAYFVPVATAAEIQCVPLVGFTRNVRGSFNQYELNEPVFVDLEARKVRMGPTAPKLEILFVQHAAEEIVAVVKDGDGAGLWSLHLSRDSGVMVRAKSSVWKGILEGDPPLVMMDAFQCPKAR